MAWVLKKESVGATLPARKQEALEWPSSVAWQGGPSLGEDHRIRF